MSVDQRQEVLAGGVDVLQVFLLLVVEGAEHPLDQHLGEPDDGIERSAQLMGHVREELGLVAAGGFELAALVDGLPKQVHVLDGDNGLVGKRLEQGDLSVREQTDLSARDRNRSERDAAPQEGDRERIREILAQRAELQLRIVSPVPYVNERAS